MRRFVFTIPDEAIPLERFFSEMPKDLKRDVAEGLRVIATLAVERAVLLAEKTITFAPAAHLYSKEFAALGESLGLEVDKRSPALVAAQVIAPLVLDRSEAFDDILAALEEATLEVPEGAHGFLKAIIGRRTELRALQNGQALTSRVLPSLESFEVAIDLRIDFGDLDKSPTVAPVAVVHLDTDAPNTRVWFQLNEIQMESLVNELQTSLETLRKSKAWAEKR